MFTLDTRQIIDIDSKLEIARKARDLPGMQRQLSQKTDLLRRLYGWPDVSRPKELSSAASVSQKNNR